MADDQGIRPSVIGHPRSVIGPWPSVISGWVVKAKWTPKRETGTEPPLRKAYALFAEPIPF